MSQSGVVVWFTGFPASGKSTLARSVAEKLSGQARSVCVLDGDEVRATLRPGYGYDDRSRSDFYESLAGLASLLARQGLIVLVPATANRRVYRDKARELAPRFVEVFVDTPLAECQRRDPKGLYHSAPSTLPGSGASYEPPERPDVTVRPGEPSVEAVIAALSDACADQQADRRATDSRS